jgi:hypothetical protein
MRTFFALVFLAAGLSGPAMTAPDTGVAAPASVQDPAAERLRETLRRIGPAAFTARDYRPGLVRHVVLFRYRTDVTRAERREVVRRFLALRQQCRRGGWPYIVSIEQGGQISGEAAGGPFEQGFVVTFRSEGDRNYYVGQPVVTDAAYYDPAHEAFKAFVGPLLDRNGVTVFDYAAYGVASCEGERCAAPRE